VRSWQMAETVEQPERWTVAGLADALAPVAASMR